MGINDKVRTKFKVVLWSVDRQRGAVRDKQGEEYPIFIGDVASGETLHEGDIVSGIVADWDKVVSIQVEESMVERKPYESVGPDPTTVGWEPRGTPWKNPGTPHDGRFSNGGPQPKK